MYEAIWQTKIMPANLNESTTFKNILAQLNYAGLQEVPNDEIPDLGGSTCNKAFMESFECIIRVSVKSVE